MERENLKRNGEKGAFTALTCSINRAAVASHIQDCEQKEKNGRKMSYLFRGVHNEHASLYKDIGPTWQTADDFSWICCASSTTLTAPLPGD